MNEIRPIQEEELLAYVDNALDAERRKEIDAYLVANPPVAARVDKYLAHRQALRDAYDPVLQEPIPLSLNLGHMLAARRRRVDKPWRMAAAVLVALCIGGAGGWYGNESRNDPYASGIASLAREATASFQVYAQDPDRPVEFDAASGPELTRWVSSRLNRTVQIPDLRNAGYRYMGGRLVATEHGPAGLFVYDDAHGGRLAMLVRTMAIDRDTPMRPHQEDGVSGYSWADKGLGYSVVASASTTGLHPLADEMRRQVRAEHGPVL